MYESFDDPGTNPDYDHFGHDQDWQDANFDPQFSEHDAFASSDFAPDADYSAATLDNQPTSEGTPRSVDGPDVTSTSEPRFWSDKIIHFIGDKTVEGAHPDPVAQRDIEAMLEVEWSDWQNIARRLEQSPHFNDEYSEEITKIQEILAADFGQQVYETPIHVLDDSDYNAVAAPFSGGHLQFGHIFIKRPPAEMRAAFGNIHVIRTLLHEGAHDRTRDSRLVAAPKQQPRFNWLRQRKDTLYDTNGYYADSFTEPVLDPKHGLVLKGDFIEEGFVESYSMDGTDEVRGYSEGVSGSQRFSILNNGKERSGFTDGTEGLPHYDQKQDCLYMPWDYVYAVAPNSEGGIQYNPQTSSLAAYGMDLLYQHLPGLFGEMKRAHTDPDLKMHIKERINGVEDGLYAKLADMPYSYSGFRRGAITVVRALGLTERPMPSADNS